jgi:ADP-heptose:LPS heptosyltransferase
MKGALELSDRERILLIASAGIGNLLQFTPALRALKQTSPRSTIDCLCFSKSALCVMRNNPHIAEAIPHTRSSYIYADSAEKQRRRQYVSQDRVMIKELSARGYTSSINIFPVAGLKPAIFVRRIGAKKRVGTRLMNPRYRRLTRFFYTHIVEVTPEQHGIDIGFAHVGIEASGQDRQMEFSIPEPSLTAANEYLMRLRWDPFQRIIGIHPGCLARHKEKRWPIDRFAALTQWLVRTRGCRVLVFVGPDELDLEPPLREQLDGLGDSVHIDTESDIEAAAALTTACDAFVSNDSGLMHLASAVHTPVLGIFGPTDPKRYAPSGPRDRYLHHQLECSNCYDAKTMSACTSAICMERITVEQVQVELDAMLGEAR